MNNFFQKLVDKAREKNMRIMYDELDDDRVQQAICRLTEKGFSPVLLWDKKQIEKIFSDKIDSLDYYIYDWNNSIKYGSKLLAKGQIDGLISGASRPTGRTLRFLFKNVGTSEDINKASGYFLMNTSRWIKLLADCAVQPDPNAEELAEIAYLSILSAKMYWLSPRLAMLSFSSDGSTSHPMVEKVKKATDLVKKRIDRENIENVQIKGEVQLDVAISSDVAQRKLGKSDWIGDANILIFPDLNAGNIWYKIMQYFGGAQAIWPVIQGLAKPGNDLSRWCSIDDIVKLHAVTCLQASF